MFKSKILDNPLHFFFKDCVVLISTLHSSKIKDFYNHIHSRRQQNIHYKTLTLMQILI